MHISLVSASIESLIGLEMLQEIKGITIKTVGTVEMLSNKSDLILFDAKLGVDDIAQQYQLYAKQNESTKWLVINLNNIHQSLQFIQAGASGVLVSLCDREKIEHCIQSVLNGQLYLEDDFIQTLALRQIKKILLPFSELTAREFDVFCLLAEEYSIKTIADFLSITSKTAFNCQAQIRKKLVIKNQQQLLQLAKKHRLVI